MSFLATTLIFITIGCVYSQDQFDFDKQLENIKKNLQFDRIGQDNVDDRFSKMSQDMDDRFSKMSHDMDNKFSKTGQDVNKNFQFDRLGQNLDHMADNLGKQMNTFGNKMGQGLENTMTGFGNQMGSQFETLSKNLDTHFSNSQPQSQQITNALMTPEIQDQLAKLQSKCREAGHPEVPDLMERELGDVGVCIQKRVDVENLQNDFLQAMRTNDLAGFFRKTCAIWPSVHGCIQPMISSIKVCLSPKEVKAVDLSLEVVDDSNTFACENNADRIMQFMKNDGFQCYANNQADIKGCMDTSLQNIKNKKVMLTYDEEDCSDFHNLRKCFVAKMRHCSSSVPAQIMDDYFGLVTRKVCNSASSITWLSFVNIILLLVTYLYSKMF